MAADRVDAVVNLSKRRGFVFQSSEIYGGSRSAWDYGPLGVELKENVRRQWWQSMVRGRDDVVGLDSSVILAPQVWEASGHVATFTDPLTECKKCHKRWRADQLIEAYEEKHGKSPENGLADITSSRRSVLGRQARASATRSRRATSSFARASSSRWRWSSSSSPAPMRSGTSTGCRLVGIGTSNSA